MATIYNIKIKTVSAFYSYSEEDVEKILKKLIKNFKDNKTGLGFESTEVEVEKST